MIRFLFLILLLPQIVFGADWYVDNTSGNDTTGDGSSGTPYKTIQKAVDVASRADNIYLSNVSAFSLGGTPVSWSTGFTATGNNPITIQSWDNGGAITIQRPDEVSARVGAEINVGSTGSGAFNTLSNVRFVNLKFTNASNRALRLGAFSTCSGCEFDSVGTVAIESTAEGIVIENNYIHDGTTLFWNVDLNSTNTFINNYFENNTGTGVRIAAAGRSSIQGNIFITNSANTSVLVNNVYAKVIGNTFISDGTSASIGVDNASGTSFPLIALYNNLFYHFDGTSAKPIKVTSSAGVNTFGYNAFYDCNASDSHGFIINDLTANDISTTGDPFADSASDDYCVTGSDAEDAALTPLLDIGALECTASGGGGAATYSFPFVQ